MVRAGQIRRELIPHASNRLQLRPAGRPKRTAEAVPLRTTASHQAVLGAVHHVRLAEAFDPPLLVHSLQQRVHESASDANTLLPHKAGESHRLISRTVPHAAILRRQQRVGAARVPHHLSRLCPNITTPTAHARGAARRRFLLTTRHRRLAHLRQNLVWHAVSPRARQPVRHHQLPVSRHLPVPVLAHGHRVEVHAAHPVPILIDISDFVRPAASPPSG